MKDSLWAIPYCYDIIAEEEERAIKKQKVYDDTLEEKGSLLKMAKNMPKHDAFNFLRDCKCCLTHQINKPNDLVNWTDEHRSESYPREEKACKCDCRQLSRMMCRGVNLKDLNQRKKEKKEKKEKFFFFCYLTKKWVRKKN